MVSAQDVKFYKSNNNGLGGAIDPSSQIITSVPGSLFPLVGQAESVTGSNSYLCMYIKNTSSETMENMFFWKSSGTPSSDTFARWGRGSTGLNGVEQTIPNINTEPSGINWHEEENVPLSLGTFDPGDTKGLWVWWGINPGTEQKKRDDVQFRFKFTIENAGTGGTGDTGDTGGGGTGGGGGSPPPTPTNWKMAVSGDWGCESITDKVHDLAAGYDFILGTGDNAYESASCWTDTFKDVKSKMNSCYGNHEYEESGGEGPYKTFFGHSKTYFSFNFQNVHIVVCDTNINMDSGSAQNNFVTSDLNAADSNPDIDWIFAVMHHPWFGASSKHSYNNGNAVEAFMRLFQTHKVIFVFCGHNHNWQRTKQVTYNSSDTTNPSVFEATSPFKKTASGLIHVISGTGGHDNGDSLYALSSQPSFQGYQNRSNNGIFEIVASNNGQTLTCSFVNTGGNKFDTFVITST